MYSILALFFQKKVEQTESNLRELLKQGISNIKALGFDVCIIQNLQADIGRSGYRVQFMPTGLAAYADFYLAKY